MRDDASPPVTALVHAWRQGDRAALDQLIPIVYDEIRRLAAALMKRERPGHTFSATDLASEAFFSLAGGQPCDIRDRAHFFAIAARHMRQILVHHARERSAQKRGGLAHRVACDAELIAGGRPAELVALDEALTAFAAVDERRARVVELYYFGGMAQKEIALALDIHLNTVARDLRLSRAWLHRHLLASD
jgi:RNA polymerase sigma factor (TIGR02999 family)